MNERERFEKGTDHAFFKLELFEYRVGARTTEYMLAKYYGIYKKGKEEIAEISKQDEKELIEALIEALIETTMKMEEESIAHHWDKICPARSRMINNIIVIEKHTGKTWEEINGTYTEK